MGNEAITRDQAQEIIRDLDQRSKNKLKIIAKLDELDISNDEIAEILKEDRSENPNYCPSCGEELG